MVHTSSSEKPVRVTYTGRISRRKGGSIVPAARKEEEEEEERSKEEEEEEEEEEPKVLNPDRREDSTSAKVKAKRKPASTKISVPKSEIVSVSGAKALKPSASDLESAQDDSENLQLDVATAEGTSPSRGVSQGSGEMKPPSSTIVNKSSRDDAQDDISDDAVSIAESTKTSRKRKIKTEAERMEWFLNDENCDELEAHRVKCARCKEWVDLHPKRKYVMKSWLTHKRLCETPLEGADDHEQEQASPNAISESPDSHNFSVIPAVLHGRTEGKEPEPGLVTKESEPSLQAQSDQHIQSVSGTAESQTLSPPRHVTLSGPSSELAPPERPALSIGKRSRDLSDSDEQSGEPRSVRPRATSYRPPAGVALWQTLTTPFRSFVEGFIHGMGRNSSS